MGPPVPGAIQPENVIRLTNATLLKRYDADLSAAAEHRDAHLVNQAIQHQMGQSPQAKQIEAWAHARAARMQHLKKQRTLRQAAMPAADVPHKPVKVHATRNNRGGAGTSHVCKMCGEPRKGTHGRTGCPNMPS